MHVTYLKNKPSRPKQSASGEIHEVKRYFRVISWRMWKIANCGRNRLDIKLAEFFPGQVRTLLQKQLNLDFGRVLPEGILFEGNKMKKNVQYEVTNKLSWMHWAAHGLANDILVRKLQKLDVTEIHFREGRSSVFLILRRKPWASVVMWNDPVWQSRSFYNFLSSLEETSAIPLSRYSGG